MARLPHRCGWGRLFLVSGAPPSTGKDEEQMLRALRMILDEHARASEPAAMSLSAGVSRGTVFCGDVGADLRRTYVVMGEPVTLAARFAGGAEAGQILATGDVLDRARSRYYVSPGKGVVVEEKRFARHGLLRRCTDQRAQGGAAGGVAVDRPRRRARVVGGGRGRGSAA